MSAVLQAMGVTKSIGFGTLRLSVGRYEESVVNLTAQKIFDRKHGYRTNIPAQVEEIFHGSRSCFKSFRLSSSKASHPDRTVGLKQFAFEHCKKFCSLDE